MREMTHPTRVFVVDDHPVVRQGLKLMLDQETDMVLCGEAESAREARRNVREATPDIIVADVSLKDASGIELVKELRELHPDVPVLVLSMHDESLYAERALRAGARGYVMKDEAPDRLITAIREIVAGGLYLSGRMTARLLTKFVDGPSQSGRMPMESLTDRELEIFEFIGRGLGTRHIAETLHLSVKTIETHRRNIKRKLKLSDATSLMQHAIHWVQQQKPL